MTFTRRTGEWIVLGHHRRSGDNGELLLFREDLRHIKCVDLKHALSIYREYRGYRGYEIRPEAHVSALHPTALHPEELIEPVSFALINGELVVEVSFVQKRPEDPQLRQRQLLRMLDPLLASLGAAAKCVWHGPSDGMPPHEEAATLLVSTPWRAKTALDLLSTGEGIAKLVNALDTAGLTHESTLDLIRGGAAELLVGESESHWLEAKGAEFDLDCEPGKISLARAVARFCNSQSGGLIVFGAKTRHTRGGGEVIASVRGVTSPNSPSRYIKVLRQFIYPFPVGLTIEAVETSEGRHLVVINVPVQDNSLIPFLVQGAIMDDGRVQGSFISIVQRAGEETIPWTAPMFHSWLVAGRAQMRGGHDRTGRP